MGLRCLRRIWLYLVLACVSMFSFAPDGALRADEPSAPEKPVAESGDQPTVSRKQADEEYELLKLFADTLDQVERNYVKDISRRELFEAAIRGMMSKLDPYSNYIPPAEIDGFKGSVESEFGGIGIQVEMKNGRLLIVSPIYGTPAYRAGLRAGDWISDIDGQTTRAITLDDAVKRLKGSVGTTVKVTVVHAPEGKPETVPLTREIVRVDTVLGERHKDDDAWDYFYDREKKIGYVRITAFGRHTTQELRRVLDELTADKLRGLVLDLRFNPGGLLSSAIEISDLFVADGKIVSTAGRNVPDRTVMAHKEGTFEGFPMAVLVNRFSASASEIVSACLQDHDRAIIVGERTWGKGSVQNIIELEEGKSALKLTTAGYQRPNGKNIHRAEGAAETDDWGVRPNDGYEHRLSDADLRQLIEDRRQRDILRKPAKDSEAQETSTKEPPFVDRQLQKALEFINAKLADSPAAPAASVAPGTAPPSPK